ncbi:hypothetical protein EVJ58_g1976 [Rhodofomes roseus]|uniref:Uncharacterized protein n=1 Tax=Rhodofomes roseus TaxID=34475 RepID=A0A4Y9YS97_9APHY|nr:hypothetical protein EVJ58_g1976 [Rhodofomes roseus]
MVSSVLVTSSMYKANAIVQNPPEILVLSEPTRPTTPQDWERFDFYASRIRELRCAGHSDSKQASRALSADLYRWLLASRPTHQLLPRLSSLIWKTSIFGTGLDCTPFLSSPQLSSVSIDMYGNGIPTTSHAILPALLRLSPDLQELRLWMREDWSTHPISRAFFGSFKKLRIIEMKSAMSSIFDLLTGLSTLPDLTKMNILISDYYVPDQRAQQRTAPRVVFRSLEELKLRSSFTPDTHEILRACHFPQLQCINLMYTTPWDERLSALDDFVCLISQCCSHSVLEMIEIVAREDWVDEDAEVQSVTAGVVLKPLIDFHRLCSFHLSADMRIVLDDGAVRDMAVAWPRLKCLALVNNHLSSAPPAAMTLKGLAYLARYCPLLETLAINVDTSSITAPPPSNGHCNRVLQSINAVRSPASGDPAAIGAFLHAIFPNFKRINASDETTPEDELVDGSWGAVEAVIEALKLQSASQQDDFVQKS